MIDVKLTIELDLKGPILTRSTAIGKPGIDDPVARTGSDKVPYIPYSLIKGKLKESWESLNVISPNRFNLSVLGLKSEETLSRYKPYLSRITISDFLFQGEEETEKILQHRIRIDPERGSVDKNALMILERPFAPGKTYTFKGTVEFTVSDEEEWQKLENDIKMGLCWITSLGSDRTVGFGELVAVRIDNRETESNPATLDAAPWLSLTINKPFCVAKRRKIDNVFESEITLSGSVIRGSIASTLKQFVGLHPEDDILENNVPDAWRMFAKYFNDITYSHAFPVRNDKKTRPVVPPQSLVKVHNGDEEVVFDAALAKGPFVFKDNYESPAFSIDWKNCDDINEEYGWERLEHELRVRTAIDSASRRVQKGDLFAYDMIVPDGFHWLAKVDFDRIPDNDRAATAEQLFALLGFGIRNIGKTKAKAIVESFPDCFPVEESNPEPIDNRWVITLQTPALLCDSTHLNETSDAGDIYAAYQAMWNDISDGALKLVPDHYFARQTLSGRYLIKRFQPDTPYNPFLLTEAGSVFVLESTGDAGKAQSYIEEWMKHGLPVPGRVADKYSTDWKKNPYLPCDGFGEIAVNLHCHTEKCPSVEEVIYVKEV